MPSPYDDYNVLEAAAQGYIDAGDIESALRIFFYMADGDSGLEQKPSDMNKIGFPDAVEM